MKNDIKIRDEVSKAIEKLTDWKNYVETLNENAHSDRMLEEAIDTVKNVEKLHIEHFDGTTEAEERIIILEDSSGNTFVSTNASKALIKEAINHKNDLLEAEEYLTSDFEIIQEYIQSKGKTFEMVETQETYLW